MKWTDTRDIAIALAEKFPDVDPAAVRFTDLRRWPLRQVPFVARSGIAAQLRPEAALLHKSHGGFIL